MRCFHYRDFDDLEALVACKQQQRISVCIPTRNEADTIGTIVEIIRSKLVENVGLVDEILVVDSNSDDRTREIASDAGAQVHRADEILPHLESHTGKGENLWKALHVATGDVLCYIDGDIANFHSGFVTGLIGPLLNSSEIDYVKAYYERPLVTADALHSNGGGRVSEILVRPFISAFYPELVPILQPLSGEYAARRSLLETLTFPTGYGVEIAHLIDLIRCRKLDRIAQTDLVRRVHRNRDEGDLGDTAFAILRVLMRRLERDGKLSLHEPMLEVHQRWRIDANRIDLLMSEIPEPERPAIREDA